MNSKLLKESIIDAKAVRATALANAKAALEEAFNQRFSAVFADKLREDSATEADGQPTVEQPVAEATEKDKVGATKPSKSDGTKDWSSKNIDAAGKPTTKNITPNTVPSAKDGGDAIKSLSKDNKGNAFDGTPSGIKETTEEGKEEESVEETVTNEDLDEIIRELEAEAGAIPTDEPPPSIGGEAPVGGAEDGAPETELPAEESQEIKAGDTVTITGTVSKAPPEAGVEPPPGDEIPGGDVPGGEAPTSSEGSEAPPQMEEEDIDLNELLASLNEESKEDHEKDETKAEEKAEEKSKEVDETLTNQLNEVTNERNDAYKTVEYLRSQINEVNLLNAKLLYTNKLFKEFGMNRDQKIKVVEAFDLTKNVREVKMTYANWCESLNFGGNAQRRPQAQSNITTITEGKASKTVASTKPSKEVITEGSNEMAMRFKKLAGISSKK